MARRSVAAERREQIIEATIRTIAEHGVSGASLDRIADAAGMSRGHVRHFVGNRDRLLLDTARAVFADETGAPSVLPGGISSLDEALDFLFGVEFTTSDAENAVVLGLVELSRTAPEIAEVLTTAYSRTSEQLCTLVMLAHPGSSEEDCVAVADGVLAAALGNVFMGDFHDDPDRTARIRRSTEALLATLSAQ